jgi:hypothetical protein
MTNDKSPAHWAEEGDLSLVIYHFSFVILGKQEEAD